MAESSSRSLVKTFSWRVTGSSATFLVSYIVSGDFSIAGTIAIAQLTVNTVLYFIHERIWNKITWGRLD